MLKETSRLKVRGPQVVSEIIDGEAIIIDLLSGNYYTLGDVGAEIWDSIQDGVPIGNIVARLATKYEAEYEAIRRSVMRLLDELTAEALIASDGVAATDKMHAARFSRTSPGGKPPFVDPVLHKYTDMQELLLVDPIHEVDASGWPKLPDDAPNPG